jgi:hypothetical protein
LAPSAGLDEPAPEPASEPELEPFADPAALPEPPELLLDALELLPDADRAARVRALAPERGPESDLEPDFESDFDDEPLLVAFVVASA